MIKDQIYEIISGWAQIPTWHTCHPADQRRFSSAIRNVVEELGPAIDIEDFEKALRRHAKGTPIGLGSPKNWDSAIEKYVLKAETIFTYEYERLKIA